MFAIVTAYHNVAQDPAGRPLGMLDGYDPTHPIVAVFATTFASPTKTGRDFSYDAYVHRVCNRVYELLNIGDDPAFGEPNPEAVAYRARGNRSLSVGDVISVGGRFYSCQRVGWMRLDKAPIVVERTEYGTTPLNAVV